MIRSRGDPLNGGEIDEVYPRIFMSGYGPARNWFLLQKHKISHILTVTPYAKPEFASKGV